MLAKGPQKKINVINAFQKTCQNNVEFVIVQIVVDSMRFAFPRPFESVEKYQKFQRE